MHGLLGCILCLHAVYAASSYFLPIIHQYKNTLDACVLSHVICRLCTTVLLQHGRCVRVTILTKRHCRRGPCPCPRTIASTAGRALGACGCAPARDGRRPARTGHRASPASSGTERPSNGPWPAAPPAVRVKPEPDGLWGRVSSTGTRVALRPQAGSVRRRTCRHSAQCEATGTWRLRGYACLAFAWDVCSVGALRGLKRVASLLVVGRRSCVKQGSRRRRCLLVRPCRRCRRGAGQPAWRWSSSFVALRCRSRASCRDV
jgi:hypothetical protein